MPHLNFHPAPGFGELMPGSFVVPQNPIRDVGTALVPSVRASGQVTRVPHLGELMPAMFTVPQNPVRDAMLSPDVTRPIAGSGKAVTAVVSQAPASPCSGGEGMSGLGCGCGSCGMGDMQSTLTDIESAMSQSYGIGSFQIPLWALVAAGVGAYLLLSPGGSEYRAESAALRSKHRGYRRAARYAGSLG